MVLDEEIRRSQKEELAKEMIEKIKEKADKGFMGWKRKPSGNIGVVRFEKKINGKTVHLHFSRNENLMTLDITKGILGLPRELFRIYFDTRDELAKEILKVMKNESKIKKLAKLKGLL